MTTATATWFRSQKRIRLVGGSVGSGGGGRSRRQRQNG